MWKSGSILFSRVIGKEQEMIALTVTSLNFAVYDFSVDASESNWDFGEKNTLSSPKLCANNE